MPSCFQSAFSPAVSMVADDFRGIASPLRKRPREGTAASQEAGQERQYLRVFETAPSQMLNAYGEARHFKMEDAAVWDAVSGPLKTGAAWMTEYASPEAERRGIAINRYLKGLEDYLLYQLSEKGMRTNEYVLKPAIFGRVCLGLSIELHPSCSGRRGRHSWASE